MTVRTVSYGAGVQSTALLVLAAQGAIDYRTFLFANVGDDSEHPDSLRYFRDVAVPYAADHGLELVELHRLPVRGHGAVECSAGGVAPPVEGKGAGDVDRCPSCGRLVGVIDIDPDPTRRDLRLEYHQQPETLWGRLTRPGSRSLPIPVRMSNGAPGSRSCTADFKIRVIANELKGRGATVAEPATVALGISTDEIERAKPGVDPRMPFQLREYPLLDLGLSRSDCKRVIADAGLPVPGKSACFFCPFHDKAAWSDLAHDTPELFAKSCELEAHLNQQRDEMACQGVGLPPREHYRTVVGCRAHGEDCPFDTSGDDCEPYDFEYLWGPPLFPPDRWTCTKCKREVALDDDGNVAFHGKDHVWLTRYGKPLAEVIATDQGRLDLGLDGCDSGYCFT